MVIKFKLKRQNRGTGAGGANTNKKGLRFEDHTFNYNRLIEKGFQKYTLGHTKTINGYYLSKKIDDSTEVVFVTKGGFSKYTSEFLGFKIHWQPDEAYLIVKRTDGHIINVNVKILEKKSQSVSGTVDIKLWASPQIRREIEICFEESNSTFEYKVEYALCLDNYYRDKDKYHKLFTRLLPENDIYVFYGHDSDYFTKLDAWISPHLSE